MDLFRMFGQPGGVMGGGGLGMGMAAPPAGPFRATYRCYPVVMMANKASLESGDKIILPASALDSLARLRVTYPMMFSLVNPVARKSSRTHSGVMEFSAEEGTVYLPYWMMQNLLVESGGLLEVTNASLKKGTYVKLQPHSVKFTQLHNPRVVLERALRNFSCLTKGDTIAIQHGSENFYLDVLELKPDTAVSIIETDVNVDFEAAKDAPAYSPAPAAASSSSSAPPADMSFANVGSNPTVGSDVTAAQRDFSNGGWGSSGTEAAVEAASPVKTASGGSDYFSKLGSGNKLSAKRKATSTQPSPSPSPTTGPTAITASSSLDGLSSLKQSGASGPALARPQSALAGRTGGYSMVGGSSSSSAPSRAPSSTAAASSSSASATAARPSSAMPSPLPTITTKSMVIERQGAWNYHYELDGKGGKKLMRRLPAKDEAPVPATTSSASAPAPAAGGLAAMGPGHRLK